MNVSILNLQSVRKFESQKSAEKLMKVFDLSVIKAQNCKEHLLVGDWYSAFPCFFPYFPLVS